MALGYDPDEYALVQGLRRDLNDNYPRNSILKELVQNAEDAKATTVAFA